MVPISPVRPITSADLSELVNTLATSLEVARLACNDIPMAMRALDRIDRQVKVLYELAERLREGALTAPEPSYVATPAKKSGLTCLSAAESVPAVFT